MKQWLGICCAVLLTLDCTAAGASSFYVYPMYTPDFMMSVSAQGALDNAIRERAKQRHSSSGASPTSASPGPASFAYQRDVSASKANSAKLAAGIAEVMAGGPNGSPEKKAQVRANFENQDIAKEMAPRFAASHDPYDMVTALTVFGIVSFEILNPGMVGNRYSAALHQHLRDSYAQVPAARSASAQQKQRFAESLYWAAYLSSVMYALATKQSNGAALARLQASTREHLKAVRINPDRYTLTAQGLALK